MLILLVLTLHYGGILSTHHTGRVFIHGFLYSNLLFVDITVMQNFWTEISKIQRDAVVWMHEAFIMMLPAVESQAFIQCLYKLLMMAHGEHYSKVDNWPAEAVSNINLASACTDSVIHISCIRGCMEGQTRSRTFKKIYFVYSNREFPK